MVLFQFSARSGQDNAFAVYGKRTDVGIVQKPSRRLATIIIRTLREKSIFYIVKIMYGTSFIPRFTALPLSASNSSQLHQERKSVKILDAFIFHLK
jgi:hypothetical protein